MPKKQRKRIVNLFITSSAFASIFKRLRGDRSDYDFSALHELRQLLTNEKSKILNTIKNQKPESVYRLAKILGRDFKAVRDDVKLLEKFGFIHLKPEVKGKRKSFRPEISIDSLQVNISFQ